MMALPWVGGVVNAWRLEPEEVADQWDSGAGAARVGGRWNPIGYPVVYCAADPATAILEVAVNKGFPMLDIVRHVLTKVRIFDAANIFVVRPETVINPGWLSPGAPSYGQQTWGRALLEEHAFIAIPSTVCGVSWNVIFNPVRARGLYEKERQDVFALDTRLNPPPASTLRLESARTVRSKTADELI